MLKWLQKKNRPHPEKKQVLLWGGLFCISLCLNLAARLCPGFAEWYAVHMYPIWVGTLGRVCSLVPFSVMEVVIYLAVLLFVTACVQIFRKKLSCRKAVVFLVKAAVCVFTLFTLNCGINYQRTTFSERADFSLEKSTEGELIALCEYLAEEVNRSAQGLSVDESGYCVVTGDVAQMARASMQTAALEYPELSGYYPDAKPVMSTWFLSYQLLQGVYSPFTVEANYNSDIPDYDIPSTVCHELSHLKGFMREDEANFIAWLACRVSESQEFRYSGHMMAFVYAGNALYRQNPDAYREIRLSLCEQAQRDLVHHNAYWDPYRGPVAEVSDKVNDVYLKANSQEDGVKSYGRMVDLLLAWMREQG